MGFIFIWFFHLKVSVQVHICVWTLTNSELGIFLLPTQFINHCSLVSSFRPLNRAGQIRLLGGAFQLIQWWAWIKQEWLSEYPSPASLQLQLARRAVMAQVCTVGTLETRSCNLLIWSKATDVNLSDTINATTNYLMMTGTYSRYRLSMLLTISLDDYWNVFPLDLLCFSLERDRPFTLTKKRHE